jgi:hypothetical protein
MGVVEVFLAADKLIDAGKNLWDLMFVSSEDLAKPKKYKFRTTKYSKNAATKHYRLTIEGNRVIDIEPLD